MRGYSALRRGRCSEPGVTYFLTICTANGGVGLTEDRTATAIYHKLNGLVSDGSWILRAATVMPDHIHLLVRLGNRLALSQRVGRLKSQTKPALVNVRVVWQETFHDHKLAPDEPVQSVIHYLFMNPYRARLIPTDAAWPWFRLGEEEAQWLAPVYAENVAIPEWLERGG